MCRLCHNRSRTNKSHEEAWQEQVVEHSNASQVLGDLIEKGQVVLDFYYGAQIEGSKKETRIKLELEAAIHYAKKYHAQLEY